MSGSLTEAIVCSQIILGFPTKELCCDIDYCGLSVELEWSTIICLYLFVRIEFGHVSEGPAGVLRCPCSVWELDE